MKEKKSKIKDLIINQKLLLIIILLIVVLSLVNKNFFSIKNLISIIEQSSIMGIMAAGMTVLLISGSFDLSVGAVLAFTGIISFLLQPYGLFISILGGLITGCLIGFINGLLVVKGGINAFIVTLSMSIILRGLGLGLSNSTPITGKIDIFTSISNGDFLFIPNLLWILLFIYISIWFLLKYTRFGRNDYAIGGNAISSKLAGINVDLNTIFYFIITSFTAAVAGILYSSRVNTASAVFGEGIEMNVIVAAVLGGASLNGGKGQVSGTIQGVIILGLIERAMVVLNIDTNFQLLARGLIIVVIVVFDTLISRRQIE